MELGDFDAAVLNQDGLDAVDLVRRSFGDLGAMLEVALMGCREASLARTKLQEASFWAIRAVAARPENRKILEETEV